MNGSDKAFYRAIQSAVDRLPALEGINLYAADRDRATSDSPLATWEWVELGKIERPFSRYVPLPSWQGASLTDAIADVHTVMVSIMSYGPKYTPYWFVIQLYQHSEGGVRVEEVSINPQIFADITNSNTILGNNRINP